MVLGFFNISKTETPEVIARRCLAKARVSFEAAVEDLLQTAEAADATGSAEWDARLNLLGVPIESGGDRYRHAQGGLAQVKGAPLMEFRSAIEALVAQGEMEYWAIHDIYSFLEEYTAHRSRLTHAVERETDRYAERVKPKAEIHNVFAIALHSSQNHAAQAGKHRLQTLRCRKCGAPRLDEQVVDCQYCGHTLFE